MEILGIGLTALTTAGAPTALTAGSAGVTAGAVGSTLGSLGSAGLSILQAGSSAFSILSTLSAANAQAENLKDQGFAAMLDAGQKRVEAVEDQADIKRELLQTIGRRRVAYAASGLDLGVGAAADQEQQDVMRADELITRSENRSSTALQNGLARMDQANRLSRRLKSNAIISAIGTGLGTAAYIMRRGPSVARR